MLQPKHRLRLRINGSDVSRDECLELQQLNEVVMSSMAQIYEFEHGTCGARRYLMTLIRIGGNNWYRWKNLFKLADDLTKQYGVVPESMKQQNQECISSPAESTSNFIESFDFFNREFTGVLCE